MCETLAGFPSSGDPAAQALSCLSESDTGGPVPASVMVGFYVALSEIICGGVVLIHEKAECEQNATRSTFVLFENSPSRR